MIHLKCSGNCKDCGKCGLYISGSECNSIKNHPHNMPQDFRPDFHSPLTYGIAFDIGTTTVSGTLWEMENADCIGSFSLPNYQSKYGSDVISRIMFCNQADENLLLMHQTLILCINDIIYELCTRCCISPVQITRTTFVGNSTMSHLFLNTSPRSLAVYPFKPAFTDEQTLTASDLGLNIHPMAEIILLPNIDSHIGSDTTGMLLSTRLSNCSGTHIAVDIGTNGEIAAVKNGQIFACSTAAGPAFEGASIHQGMRAVPGVIEKVEYKNYDIKIKTITGQSPIGICGSGLIDAAACLLKCGIIDKSGRMITKEEAIDAGLPQTLSRRLITFEKNPAFILAFSDSDSHIILTQKDIREIQLAKGAILSGIQTLMNALDMKAEDLDSILLAGTFGNHINIESALRIGLFPQISKEKIKSVGNAAGTGASMALLSNAERSHAIQISKQVKHVELSANEFFKEFYINAMMF